MSAAQATPVDVTSALNPALARRAKLYERQRDGFQRRKKRIASRVGVLLVSDLAAVLIARALAMVLADRTASGSFLRVSDTAGPLAEPGAPASLVLWILLVPALIATGAYSRHRGLNTGLRLASGVAIAALAATVPFAAVVGWERAIAGAAGLAVVVSIALRAARIAAEAFVKRIWPRDRGAAPAVLVGPPGAEESRIAHAVTAGGGDYRIVAHHVLSSNDHVEPQRLAEAVERLIVALSAEALILTQPLPAPHLSSVVDEALSMGCLVLTPPHAAEVPGLRPRLVWHHDQPLLEFDTPVLQLSALVTKRLMDVIGATVMLLLLSPLMLLLAIGVKVDSPGPVFFLQPRAGLGGRRFLMIKFRTMRAGADDLKANLAHLNQTGDSRLFKIKADPRVTLFGSFLRRWSLDELPQFWNVLLGDMSLVGPRPFFESDFAAYEDHHFRRLDTKPGITGLWQVGGRSEVVNFEDVVYLDRRYIEQWSLWLDLSIMVRTMPSVIRRTGAY